MFIIVLALNKQGVTEYISSFLGQDHLIVKYGVSSFISSNLINNIPMSVLMSSVLETIPASNLFIASTLYVFLVCSISFDKTVIFISHRLSTTVMADVIYMLENGEIVESGSHEELMAKNGKYAYMFNLQAEKYK